MLILVAVVVKTAIDSGLFGKTKEAGDSWKNAEAGETGIGNGTVEINGETYNSIEEYVGINETENPETTWPYLPDNTFTQVAGTNLSIGLVIQDASGNEYVWIEVPRTAEVYGDGNLNITTFGDDEYNTIETALKTYTATYRNGTKYEDTYLADSTTGWFANPDAYNTAKKKMLKSVYENGGFWIGRYEAGIETARTASGTATTATPVSKPNMYPYNYVTRTQAKVLADNLSTANYTASLMYGVQWDLVLKYLETKGATEAELKGDSTNWGNYYYTTYNITNENVKYSTNNGASYSSAAFNNELSGSFLLTTGASSSFSKQNIYDIAGNVWEWTLESTLNTQFPCVSMGGDYADTGSNYPASTRYFASTSLSNGAFGFRVILYK